MLAAIRNGLALRRASTQEHAATSSATEGGGRGDLLAAIRNGPALRRASTHEHAATISATEREGGSGAASSAGGLMGALAARLEARRNSMTDVRGTQGDEPSGRASEHSDSGSNSGWSD